MGTQFFGSLLGVGIAVGSLVLMTGFYAYKRWYKKEIVEIKGEIVTLISIFVLLGAVSGYKLAESSYFYAKKGTHYVVEAGKEGTQAVLDAGQHAISGTIKYFSVAVLEGVGKTYDHFEEKWDAKQVKNFENLELRVLSSKRNEKHGKTSLHVVLEVTNRGQETIDFKELVTHKLLLLKNKNSDYFPVTFDGTINERMLIPPATTIEQEIDIVVHGDNYPTILATPSQQLELK